MTLVQFYKENYFIYFAGSVDFDKIEELNKNHFVSINYF